MKNLWRKHRQPVIGLVSAGLAVASFFIPYGEYIVHFGCAYHLCSHRIHKFMGGSCDHT